MIKCLGRSSVKSIFREFAHQMKLTEQNRSVIQDQYRQLEEVGISLNSHYTVDDLIDVIDKQQHGHHEMSTILSCMGDAFGQFPHFHLSDDVWLFDTECVEDPQAYADIAYRVKALTAPDLPIDNIKSDLDFINSVATLSFDCQGVPYVWELEIDDDWVDVKVFDKFCHLLESLKATKALAISDQGQSAFLIYTDQENLPMIETVTGLSWKWLENPPVVA